ncbi:MAG TPA: FAD-binding protein [Vicinamibacterales bacterium]|nr:FAD-binding protein [Vicinamibacterales bacterium]
MAPGLDGRPERIANWLGNVVADVDAVLRPRSITELQEMIGGARDRLLVMGGRMSKTALMDPPGRRALDMRGLNAIVEHGPDSVTVGGGITVFDLSRALYERGRQIPGFTITADPSVGGSITAPTKGANHPFNPGANGVSGAVLRARVVRPDGELVELQAGRDDEALALLRDSYSAAGVVAEATLRTRSLASADVHEEVLPLPRFLEDTDLHRRALEQRTLVFPKLGLIVMRVHENRRPAEPEAPFESLLTGPNTPYVRLARVLPRAARAGVLRAAVRLGIDRKTRHRLHVQNLTPYPRDGSAYLDFITWSLPIGRFAETLPRIVTFCRTHPDYPAESLIEIFRTFPENRFLDADERVAIDPVSFDRREGPRWERFYRDYNRMILELGASPFLNQTRYITASDMRAVYGARYDAWRDALLQIDPTRKLGSRYLDQVLGAAGDER